MAGTKLGGLRAAATNKARHGDDFYANIGAKGGRNGHTGGFASKNFCYCDGYDGRHYKAHCAGAKGGRISRRPKNE